MLLHIKEKEILEQKKECEKFKEELNLRKNEIYDQR